MVYEKKSSFKIKFYIEGGVETYITPSYNSEFDMTMRCRQLLDESNTILIIAFKDNRIFDVIFKENGKIKY